MLEYGTNMPKVGKVEFEKIGIKTPPERMGRVMLAVDEEWRVGIAQKREERAVEVHPANSRFDQFRGILDRYEVGFEVADSISEIIDDIRDDPKKGMYSRIIGFWYQFAREHSEILSSDRVKGIWSEAISLEERPVFKLDSYGDYVELTGERDERILTGYGQEVVEGLPTWVDLEKGENISDLEFLLRMMASLRRIGVSTDEFEKYFESLIEEVDLSTVNVWIVRHLFDFMCIYHRESGEVPNTIRSMIGHILTKGDLNEYDKCRLLEGTSDDLAFLNDFESAGEYWKQFLVSSPYPHVDCPSSLIGCAIRTGNVAKLDEINRFRLEITEKYVQRETENWTDGDETGYKESIFDDASNAWGQGWLLALRFHCGDEHRQKYLESGLILAALSAGHYDNSLEILLEFCVRYPALTKFRTEVKKRIEIGLNLINEDKLSDRLRAVDLMKAAIKWQREVAIGE